MKKIEHLTNLLARMPGIGPRQARRIVQFLIASDQSLRTELAGTIQNIRGAVHQCTSCFRFDEIPEGVLCAVCSDHERDSKTLMLVEKDVDLEAIENAGMYRGVYFVLGGLIPMARQRKSASSPRTKEFETRLAKNGTAEIVCAFSTTPEGDYTTREIVNLVRNKYPGIKTSILGRGLSLGAEIEYADQETLKNAFKNRA